MKEAVREEIRVQATAEIFLNTSRSQGAHLFFDVFGNATADR
jgi:hypothetical protein